MPDKETLDKETLKAIKLALEVVREKAHDNASETTDYYIRSWLFGLTSAITSVQCALNLWDTLPIENLFQELEGMK